MMTPDEAAAEVERLYQAWQDGPPDAPVHEALGMTRDQAEDYIDRGLLPHGYEPPLHPGPLPDPEEDVAAMIRDESVMILIVLGLAAALLAAVYFGANR
jgi:hypothetical protein